MAEYVIVARHGEDSCDILTEAGRLQAGVLVQAILGELGSIQGSVLVMTSLAGRAIQFGQILAGALGGKTEMWRGLGNEQGTRVGAGRWIAGQREYGNALAAHSVVVLVTHGDSINRDVVLDLGGSQAPFLEYGQAVMIKVGQEGVTLLPRKSSGDGREDGV